MNYTITNIERGIEMCFWSVFRTHCTFPTGTVVRPWQTLDADDKWAGDAVKGDRTFPLVSVACSPTAQDPENFRTGHTTAQIAMLTDADEDQSHDSISTLYTALIATLNNLYGDYTKQTLTGAEYVTWAAGWTAYVPSTCTFGGFIWGPPSPPETIDAVNAIGVSMEVHYSRSDF